MFKEDIDSLVSRIENLVSTKTIVGEPIISGNITIIPIVTTSAGFGLGKGEEQGGTASGSKGTGAGAGMRISPSALLIIQGDNVQVYSLAQKGSMAKLAELIPDVVSKFKNQ